MEKLIGGRLVALTTIRTHYGAAALAVLRDVVRDAKSTDPMATVTLLVPNNLAGIVARRALAAGLSHDTNGVAGIQIATLPRLAERLGSPSLAPRRPATSAVVAAAWRAALQRAPSVFDAVKEHPATVRALVEAHRELRDLSDTGRDGVAAASRLTADLVRLHRQVRADLADGWYDQVDILDAGTARLAGDRGSVAELGHLVLYLPQELTLAQSRFAHALSGCAETTIVLGMTDVDRADRAVRRSLDRIGHPFSEPRGRPRVAHEVFHASDSDDEVRCIVRDVVHTLAADACASGRVLYGSDAAVRPAAPRASRRGRHRGQRGRNPAGRRARDRRAASSTYSCSRVTTCRGPTSSARSPRRRPRTFDGGRLPTSRWERLSRSAAVVRGEDWDVRLRALASLVGVRHRDRELERRPLPVTHRRLPT